MTGTIWTPDLTHFPGPKYLALSRALREAVRAGTLAEGSQLPTVRDLAWALGVTPGTVSRAYALATQEGLLAATVGRGTFVAAREYVGMALLTRVQQIGAKGAVFQNGRRRRAKMMHTDQKRRAFAIGGNRGH